MADPVSAESREHYLREGYFIHEAALPTDLTYDLGTRIEQDIDAMAAELDVPRHVYLSAVCRWSTPNVRVESLVRSVVAHLRPLAAGVLGSSVRPGRASVFRKSAEAKLGTHGHQDAGYWVRPSSSRYDATTWVPLDDVDEDGGALCVLPRSHLGAVELPVDYLSPGFIDPADAWGTSAVTLFTRAGAAVTFDPRLWHASHGSIGGRVRRALAIRWVFDEQDPVSPSQPKPIPGCFGMYTSGAYLHAALRKLSGERLRDGVEGVECALERDLVAELPDPEGARAALCRLLVFLRASAQHQAADQRGMVWEDVRDLVVAPVVGLEQPR